MPESVFELSNFLINNEKNSISMTPTMPHKVKPHSDPLSLGIGEPNINSQPIHSLEVTFAGKKTMIPKVALKGVSMSDSLKYGAMRGLSGLWDGVYEFINQVGNGPKYSQYGLLPTFGSFNGMYRVCLNFLKLGDICLVEEYTPRDIVGQILHVGADVVPLKLDRDYGLDYSYLENLLNRWPNDKLKPKMIYMIPTGQDPTGVTQPLWLRQKIYKLCESHNMLIIEDNSFGYISLTADISTPEAYTESLIPSYLSLDTIGRVIHIDSFSKTVTPGLQLGFVMAHEYFVQLMKQFAEVVNDAPPGPSQLLLSNVVMTNGGWIHWMIMMSEKYRVRREFLLNELHCSLENKLKLTVLEPLFGVIVAVTGFDNLKQFQRKCLQNGLQVHLVESLLPQGDDIIRLSLGDGTDEDFREAVIRLCKIL